VKITVEKRYSLELYLQMLDFEARRLDELISIANLPAAAFQQAEKKANNELLLTVEETEGEMSRQPEVKNTALPPAELGPDGDQTIDWLRRYHEEPFFKVRPQQGIRWVNKIMRLCERLPNRWRPISWPWARTTRYATLLVTRETSRPRSLFSSLWGGPCLVELSIGQPLPGMRVPMQPQLSPEVERPAALAIQCPDCTDHGAVDDVLFKSKTEALLSVDAGGNVVSLDHCRLASPSTNEHRTTSHSVIEKPRVSVVIVSYNQAKYLGECLDSVANQSYPHLEIIVVDGGSSDGSGHLLESYRKKLSALVIEADRGQSDALNKGFALSSGDILNWLCSDDRLEQNAIAEVAEIRANKNCDLVVGGCRVIDENSRTKTVHFSGFITNQISPLSFGDLATFSSTWHRGLYFYQPEVFFSRDVWERSGSTVSEHLYYAMDYDLYLRFALAGAEVYASRRVLACSRQHTEQKTRSCSPLYLPTIRRIIGDFKSSLDLVRQNGIAQSLESAK